METHNAQLKQAPSPVIYLTQVKILFSHVTGKGNRVIPQETIQIFIFLCQQRFSVFNICEASKKHPPFVIKIKPY